VICTARPLRRVRRADRPGPPAGTPFGAAGSTPLHLTLGAVVLLLVAVLTFPICAQALPRVIFTDGTFLEVETVWMDDKYVHYLYHGRQLTVLRSDVARIEGVKPRVGDFIPPPAARCPVPRSGDQEVAIQRYFRCLDVRWTRSTITEDNQELWVYQGLVRGQLQQYVVKDGRVVRSQASAS
jgi:hypothetical protein